MGLITGRDGTEIGGVECDGREVKKKKKSGLCGGVQGLDGKDG